MPNFDNIQNITTIFCISLYLSTLGEAFQKALLDLLYKTKLNYFKFTNPPVEWVDYIFVNARNFKKIASSFKMPAWRLLSTNDGNEWWQQLFSITRMKKKMLDNRLTTEEQQQIQENQQREKNKKKRNRCLAIRMEKDTTPTINDVVIKRLKIDHINLTQRFEEEKAKSKIVNISDNKRRDYIYTMNQFAFRRGCNMTKAVHVQFARLKERMEKIKKCDELLCSTKSKKDILMDDMWNYTGLLVDHRNHPGKDEKIFELV